MPTNIGPIDRIIRLMLGLALVMLALAGKIPAWAGWIGLVPLLTGLVRVCPLYWAVSWVLGIGQD